MDRRGRSPQQNPCNQSFGGEENKVAEILAKFQSACGEVMAGLENINQGSPQNSGRGHSKSPCPPPGSRGMTNSGRGGSKSPCPPSSSNANTNLVKPHLEEILKIVQFGMKRFMEVRFQHLDNLSNAISENKMFLTSSRCYFDQFESVMGKDLDTLPDFITMWGDYAKYIQNMFDMCKDPNNSALNLQAINHPSPYISQNTFTELLRSAIALCLEVERGLRVVEIMYSKLDETVTEAQRKLAETLHKLSTSEDTANALYCDGQDWLSRFGDLEHSVTKFLTEWQKGGDQLNQPRPNLPCPPQIPELPSQNPCDFSGAPSNDTYGASMNRNKPRPSCSAPPIDPCRGPGNTQPQTNAPCSESEANKPGERKLEQMIQRFNAMNETLRQEAQQNVGHQEVLNQSMRAMEKLPQNKEANSS